MSAVTDTSQGLATPATKDNTAESDTDRDKDKTPGKEAEALQSLALSFSPSLLPLQTRWRNNGLSADFLADYVTTFFPGRAEDPDSLSRESEVKAAVSYVANELLENAMKYSARDLPYPITIRLIMEPARLVFIATNTVTGPRANRLRAFLADLKATDPQDLLLRALEQERGPDDGSGLGLVTMINDYGADLSLDLSVNADGSETVTTRVVLSLDPTVT